MPDPIPSRATAAPRDPKYRHYKPKDLGVVRLGGHDHYLGRYDSPESREKYHRLLAEWGKSGTIAAGASGPAGGEAPRGLTITELMLAFWKHAEVHYRRADGTPTEELASYKRPLRPLRRLYGSSPAAEFGPKMLKAVRQAMIDADLCRKTINQRVGRIVRLFKWAVEEELIPADVHHGLRAVKGLHKGRSKARESDPVRPVADADVDAVRPHVTRQVWAMVQLQRRTGMRPGEVTIMRAGDLDVSGRVWVYRPAAHKTEHYGHDRLIYIGPRAQEILRPWLKTDLGAYLFDPREAMAEQGRARRAARKTPMTPSQRARRGKRKRSNAPGDRYLVRSYYCAVKRACKAAGVPHWHPNQLRHNAATMLRKEFGLDVARVILGHSSPAVTEVYAEVDREKAIGVMGEVG